MRKIKTLMKQWAHQNAKDAVVKKIESEKDAEMTTHEQR